MVHQPEARVPTGTAAQHVAAGQDDPQRGVLAAETDVYVLAGGGSLNGQSIEVNDYVFPNGVIGRVVSYHIEERERIKTIRSVGYIYTTS